MLGFVAAYLIIAWRSKVRALVHSRSALGLALGFAWPFALTFSYFAAKHGLREMLADWVWPLFHYSVANNLPYGYVTG